MVREKSGRLKRAAVRLSARSEGTAAMEFALLLPFMVYMFLCATDIARALTISRRLTNAADTIAQLVSQVTNTSTVNGVTVKGSVTDTDLTQAFNSIVTTFPDVLGDATAQGVFWPVLIQPIASSVTFGPSATCPNTDPTTSVCTTATVTWSAGYNYSTLTPYHRSCTTMTQVPNSAATSLTTLPAGVFSPDSIIVADVTYKFRPLFTSWIVGTITIERTAYLPPRFFTKLTYAGNTASNITSCP